MRMFNAMQDFPLFITLRKGLVLDSSFKQKLCSFYFIFIKNTIQHEWPYQTKLQIRAEGERLHV